MEPMGRAGQPGTGIGAGEVRVAPRLRIHWTRGLKFLVVCGLALAMSLLSLFVAWLLSDRSGRAASVRKELSTEAGGPQVFLGPTILVPYTQPVTDAKMPPRHGWFAFAASRGHAEAQVRAEERRRSLYRVPVFQTDVVMESMFGPEDLKAALPADVSPDWEHAVIAVGVRNPRSAVVDGVLETAAGTLRMRPLPDIDSIAVRPQEEGGMTLSVLGAAMSGLREGGVVSVRATMRFSGAERVSMLSYAGDTTVAMRGNWPDPGFEGTPLPAERQITRQGFEAKWFVPSMARGVPPVMDVARMTELGRTAMTVNLIAVADAYQSVERALKYAPLFLGLVFLSYFLFEVTVGRPAHVAQYVLVGLAQLVFYLLLLSFAERIGFDWGFALGGTATVLLLAVNAGWVFGSARERRRALAIFTALYAMIYGLLRLEDNALLLGALGSFSAVALAMYFTRGMDWFAGNDDGSGGTRTTTV